MRVLVLLTLSLIGASSIAQFGNEETLASVATGSVIAYPTVQAALEALKAKPGVQIQTTKPEAWTIVKVIGSD